MMRGVIVAWHPDRGFGLVRELMNPTDPSSSTRDCPAHFFHFLNSEIERDFYYVGLPVDFEFGFVEFKQRVEAVNLTPVPFVADIEEMKATNVAGENHEEQI